MQRRKVLKKKSFVNNILRSGIKKKKKSFEEKEFNKRYVLQRKTFQGK